MSLAQMRVELIKKKKKKKKKVSSSYPEGRRWLRGRGGLGRREGGSSSSGTARPAASAPPTSLPFLSRGGQGFALEAAKSGQVAQSDINPIF